MAVCVKIKSSRNFNSSRDVTIYDFANSRKKANRSSKVNKLSVDTSDEVDLLDDESQSNQHNPRKKPGVMTDTNMEYTDYHIDIWYKVSQYIRPEDVGRFALICRKTAEVVQSAIFWLDLYRTYFDRNLEMPRRLQPECMSRLRGLRACTIRSLFYTYPPFIHRIAASPFTDPHRVAGRQLVFSWCSKVKGGWNYCFKLRSRLIPGSRVAESARMQQLKLSFDYLHDTYMNSEEGCQILIITTSSVHLVPQYHDQLYVKSLMQTLSQGMSQYKVRLQIANYCQQVVDEIVFVPVRQVRVLDWWNPEYYREDPTIERTEQLEEGAEGETEDTLYWDD